MDEKARTAQTQAQVQPTQAPKPQGSDNPKNKRKGSGILFGLFAVLTALLIILAVLGGAFYIVIHNNVNGLGERYRPQLQKIPIVKLALPKVADPDDPKYLTPEEIKNRYQDLRVKVKDLTAKIEEANKKSAELQKTNEQSDSIKAEDEKLKKDIEDQKAQLEQQKKALEEDKKKLDEMAAKGDKQGFKDFFEKMDKETAQKIYTEIMTEQKADADAAKFSQMYESMDAKAAAKIFEEMGTSKIDLVVNILKNMKKESQANILAGMSQAFAAEVTKKMSELYIRSTPAPQ